MSIHRRTFEAKNHPRGSAERAKLNEDPLTSEYMPSYRYVSKGPHSSTSFRTKAEAEASEAQR